MKISIFKIFSKFCRRFQSQGLYLWYLFVTEFSYSDVASLSSLVHPKWNDFIFPPVRHDPRPRQPQTVLNYPDVLTDVRSGRRLDRDLFRPFGAPSWHVAVNYSLSPSTLATSRFSFKRNSVSPASRLAVIRSRLLTLRTLKLTLILSTVNRSKIVPRGVSGRPGRPAQKCAKSQIQNQQQWGKRPDDRAVYCPDCSFLP